MAFFRVGVSLTTLVHAVQTTLCEKVKQKEPFFQNIASDDSAYYITVEALWQLSMRIDREPFLSEAQEKWKKTYKEDAKARDTLFETVGEPQTLKWKSKEEGIEL